MDAGLIWQADALRYKLDYASTSSISGMEAVVYSSGDCFARYTGLDANSLAAGVGLSYELSRGTTGTPYARAILTAPLLGVSTPAVYNLGSLAGSSNQYLQVSNLRLYMRAAGPDWLLLADSWAWVVDGATVRSGGAVALDSQYAWSRRAPSSIPLMGAAVRLSASAAAQGATAMDTVYPASEGSLSATYTGGWVFRESSAGPWIALPVLLDVTAPPAQTCNSGDIFVPTVTATDTGDASITVSSYVKSAYTGPVSSPTTWYLRTRTQTGAVTLIPDLPRNIYRATGPDYAALWFRWGFPRAQRITRRNCWQVTPQYPGSSYGPAPVLATAEVHPRVSQLLSTVLEAPHAIEDPLSSPVYCPYLVSGRTGLIDSVIGSWFGYRESVYPYTVDRHSDNADLEPVCDHGDAEARLINWWGCPHWHYFYWFPPTPSEETPLQPWEWPVDGARAGGNEYWIPLRSQWLHHPALPEVEKRRTRNSILSAPLYDGGMCDPVESEWLGVKSSWVGSVRFQRADVLPPGYMRPDNTSSAAWSSEDAALTFGGTSVSVANNGANNGDRTVLYDLARFDCKPWQWGSWISLIGLYWPSTQVDSVSVSLVGADGTETPLYSGKAPPGSALALPAGGQAKYAGSWAQDYGVGAVADQPADLVPASGISAATMGDSERCAAFELGSGRQYRTLKFVVSPIAPTTTVTFSTPVLYRPSGAPYLLTENGSQQAVLWPGDAALRFGQHHWWDGGISCLQTPEVVVGPGTPFVYGHKATALDALCWRREYLEGKDRLDGLLAEISALWDATEGRSIPKARAFTIAWLAYGAGAQAFPSLLLSNTYREVPPLCQFPMRARTPDDWLPDGDFVQESWSFVVEPRRLAIAGDAPVHLTDASDTVRTEALDPQPCAGWSITEHRLAVDNAEDLWHVRLGSRQLAHVRPWHGWFCLANLPTEGDLHLCRCHRTGHLYATWSHEGRVDVLRYSRSGAQATYPVVDAGGQAQGAVSPDGRLWAVYADGGQVYARVSASYGSAWGSAVAVASGSNPAVAVCDRSGVLFVSAWSSGAHRLYRSKDKGATWTSVGAIVSVAEGRGGLEVPTDGRLTFVYEDAGEVRRRVSGNWGATWVDG